MWHLISVVAIHKDVLPSRVTVEITVKNHFALLFELSDKSLYGEVDRMQGLVGILPSPVEVLPG